MSLMLVLCSVALCLQTMSDDERKEAAPGGAAAAGGVDEAGAARLAAVLHTDLLLKTQGSITVSKGADALATLRDAILAQPHGKSVMNGIKDEMQAMGVAYGDVVNAYLEKRMLYKVRAHAYARALL
jgi:hypothetical protein